MSNPLENDDMKKKLDLIWNEVQTSLPEINFDCDLKSDDFELVERNGEFNFEDLEDFDDVDGAETWSDLEKNFEKLLCKDEQFEAVTKSMVDIQLEEHSESRSTSALSGLDDFKTFQSTLTSSKASKECVTSAQKITKNIFDSGVSKLNMDLFNTINFDDMLANLDTGSASLTTRPDEQQHLDLRAVDTTSASTRLKDEAILAKLAAMNTGLFKKGADETMDEFNSNSRLGSVMNTAKSSTYTSNSLDPSNKSRSSPSALDMLESQLTGKSQSGLKTSSLDMVEKQLSANTQEQMRQDLNKLLDSYNIKDGNLVETRRLDLRAAQNAASHEKKKQSNGATSTNPVEAFLSMRIDTALKPNRDSNKRPRIKFLNDNDLASSSEEEEEDDEGDSDQQVFGIELYRQQKMNALKIKQAQS